ncbi:MAG TPA: HAD-IA family hydrolase [Planctomycetota bacterium]|nr:HAD-IA family hydrolase [Planctomycetota bacterium]
MIFDMDGVLVDSERFICEAAMRMFAEHGVTTHPDDFLPFVGTGENRYLGGVAERHGFAIDLGRDKARTYALYDEIVRGRLGPLPGVHAFLGSCRARGLRLAVATSADEVKMRINLRELRLPDGTFDALVNGLDVERKKPAPDIFLLAARRLELAAADCLVVEDAVNGVAAARAAGARCLALTTSFSREQLAGADFFASTLADAPTAALEW